MVLEHLVLSEAATALDLDENEAGELWDRIVVNRSGLTPEEQTILKGAGMNDDALLTMQGKLDPREYGLKHMGWIRVKGSNIQVWELTNSSMADMANGIGEAFSQEGDEGDDIDDETFDIAVGNTNRLFSGVPFRAISSGSISNLAEYDTRARFSSSLSSKWHRFAKNDGTASIPENWDSIEREPEKPEKGSKPDWDMCAGGGDWEAGWTLISVEFTGYGDSRTRIWMEPDYSMFPNGADNDQSKENCKKVTDRGKDAAKAWSKAARSLYKSREGKDGYEPPSWQDCFLEALADPSVKEFVKNSGCDKLKWVKEKPKNKASSSSGIIATAKEEEFIGVDLDGTLAKYDHWRGPEHIGEPVTKMVSRVKKWLADGRKVKIFTARASGKDRDVAIKAIEKWCKENLGEKLEVTGEKEPLMTEFWDDRAVRVKKNDGTRT